MQTSVLTLIANEKSNIEKFLNTERETLVDAAEAAEAADKQQNIDMSNGGGFRQGDILIFPSEGEIEFIGVKNLATGKVSVSFIALLQRNGVLSGFRTYPSWFTLSTHPLIDVDRKTEDGKIVKVKDKNMEVWVRHEGELPNEARAFVGSTKAMILHFAGRAFEITKAEKKPVMVIDNKVWNADTKTWGQKPGNRKFYTYKEVKNPVVAE